MHRLQSHCDFEFCLEEFFEAEAVVSYESWMAFNDDTFEVSYERGDRCMVCDADGARIEEASAVIELYLSRSRQTR